MKNDKFFRKVAIKLGSSIVMFLSVVSIVVSMGFAATTTAFTKVATGTTYADPCVVSSGYDRLDAFSRDSSGTLITCSTRDGGKNWTGWRNLGTKIKGRPAACSNGTNKIYVFVRDLNDKLSYGVFENDTLSTMAQLGTTTITESPSAVSWGSGRIDVFTRNSKNEIEQSALVNGSWQPFVFKMGGGFVGAPVASAIGEGRLEVFGRGLDNRIWYRSWHNSFSRWTNWQPMGSETYATDPAAYSGTMIVKNSSGKYVRYSYYHKTVVVNQNYSPEENLTFDNLGELQYQIAGGSPAVTYMTPSHDEKYKHTDPYNIEIFVRAYGHYELWRSSIIEPIRYDDVRVDFETVMNRYNNYDINGDLIKEINSLKFMDFVAPENTPELRQLDYSCNSVSQNLNKKLVVVLVEQRLANDAVSSGLRDRLRDYRSDLIKDGYQPVFVVADVYSGPKHQDGRTLLAIREFFKSLKNKYSNFEGAVLVGSFPDALVVRMNLGMYNTEKDGVVVNGTKYTNTDVIVRASWYNLPRAEIVLADLDGNWHNLYHEAREALDHISIVPNPGGTTQWPPINSNITFKDSEVLQYTFEDFFLVDDANISYTLNSTRNSVASFTVNSVKTLGNEVSQKDRTNPFPMAIPDIFVSRINAKNIAVNPDPNYRDKYGRPFINANGVPQTVEATGSQDIGNMWVSDSQLEKKILLDYFDRNHKYRTGQFSAFSYNYGVAESSYKPEHELQKQANDLKADLSKIMSFSNSSVDAFVASPLSFVQWLKKPVMYRGIMAHSSEHGSHFNATYSSTDLDNEIGQQKWRWERKTNTNIWEPTLKSIGIDVGYNLYRSVWESKALNSLPPSIFVHGGCNVNRPLNNETNSYNTQGYGSFQNSESVLFLLNGLSVISRCIVAADIPDGFGEGVKAGGSIGAGWKRYFTIVSQQSFRDSDGVHNKAPYAWAINGDWTLKSKY